MSIDADQNKMTSPDKTGAQDVAMDSAQQLELDPPPITLNVIGRKWLNFGLFLLIVATLFQLLAWRSANVTGKAGLVIQELLVVSGDIQLDAQNALLGDVDSFADINQARGQIGALSRELRWSNIIDDGIATVTGLDDGAIGQRWRVLDGSLTNISNAQQAITGIYDGASSIDIIGPVLIASVDEVAGKIGVQGGDFALLDAAADLRAITQKLIKEVMLVISGGERTGDALEQIVKGVQFFEITLANLSAEYASRMPEDFEVLDDAYGEFSMLTKQIEERAPEFLQARKSLELVNDHAAGLRASAVTALDKVVLARWLLWVPWVLAIVGALALLRSHLQVSADAQASASRAKNQARAGFEAQEHQESILKLLDEIAALAGGDLTIEAEVTDQITGAIADSVNYAVYEMRGLVGQIQSAADQLGSEAENAVGHSEELASTNQRHSGMIAQMASELNMVAQSIEQFAESAQQSNSVASNTMDVAQTGTNVVAKSIAGMNSIRERIQETSKRIKRLGESSQQIGEMVVTIEDLAEQTNILSLNASIKAAVGASTHSVGFAGVADEVQSLAERCADAARSIAELVNRIQKDTKNAIHAMELATGEVVAGAKMTDEAGQALDRIQSSSVQVSKLVASIANEASSQAAGIRRLSSEAVDIKNQSESSAMRAIESAKEVGRLRSLGEQLATSVSGFKLPSQSESE
jgi:twitching motility protein PilJ